MKFGASTTVLVLAAASSSTSSPLCAMAFVTGGGVGHGAVISQRAGGSSSSTSSSSSSSASVSMLHRYRSNRNRADVITRNRIVAGSRRLNNAQLMFYNKDTTQKSSFKLQMNEGGQDRVSAGGFNLSGDAPFEIRGFSLATAVSVVGVLLTVASFAEYFSNGGAGLSGLGFVYGIPVSLVGLALKYAELAPVDVETTPEAESLFEEKATETLRKIKKDVTRHRYGDEAHLDTTVKALGLVMPQSDYPQLLSLKQEVELDGELGFSMIFQSKETPFKKWVEPERIKKYNSFFGPGVEASVIKVDSAQRIVGIKLVTVDPSKPPVAAAAPVEEEVAAE